MNLSELIYQYKNKKIGARDFITEAKKYFQNTGNARDLAAGYEALSAVVKAQPELAKDVIEAFKVGLASEENNGDSLERGYWALSAVVKARPDLAEGAIKVFKVGLANEKNNSYSLGEGYEALSVVVKVRPELAEDVFEVLKVGLAKEKNDYDSLEKGYEALSVVVKAQPDLAEGAIGVLKVGLASEKNDRDSLRNGYKALSAVVKARPDLAEDVFEVLKVGLASEENDRYSLVKGYWALSDVVEARPELAEGAIEAFKVGLASEENNGDSLEEGYEALLVVVEARPELAEDVIEVFKVGLANEKNGCYSLGKGYRALSVVVETRPELAEDVFKAFKVGLANEKNNSYSLREGYKALSDVVKARPELAKDVIKTFKVGLANEKNDWGSLREGYKALSDVVKARPELAKDVFEAFKVGLANEKNDDDSLVAGYKALSEVVEARPELAKDIFSDILLPKSDYSELALVFGAKCMKKCKIDDFKNLTNEQEKYLRVLSKLKYLKESEISYFINNYGADKIEDYNFGPQQRCMNVLMAKLGEESGLSKEETVNYRKDIENKTYQDNADWLEPASFKGAEVFGCWFPGYIKKTTKYLSVHDSVYWLPENMGDDKNKSFVSFVERNLVYTDNNAEKKVRSLNEMEIIAKNWKYLKPEEEKGSFKDVLAICQSRKYEDQEYTAFATEAAKAGVSEETYKDYEDIYKAGLKVPEPFDSSKEFRFVNYVGRFLPRDDARVGFFGNYTDCCQHFSGVGKSCAISTIKDPYSQLFVIEKDGKIVAGSWVWENKEGKYRDVCFDNIEAIGNFAENPMINKIYEQAGIYLTKEANCRKVTIGMGYQDADVSGYNKTENIALPTQYGSAYSDAKGTQVLLAENKEAKPLDKTQESKRFVREACLLDFEKLDKISEICFPDSDAGLQKAGDRLSGLVLVDEIKGAVGYCLYDEEEKYISDMAVLPEYRKDKNASSQKLMAEMIKKIKEIGGEWSAELREGTTLRYMKIMQERGIVDMQIGEVDHVMDDGSKVYSVTFKPKETQREKTNKLSIQPDKNRDIR